MEQSSEFKVDLDVYSGPLDLLLYLIKRTEVDIWTVPITAIASQFVAQIEVLQDEGHLDLEQAGEFVVLAATLLELKSELLLPRVQADASEPEPEDDPRFGLVRQLIEFKRYRDLAQVLEQGRHRQARCYSRPEGLVGMRPGEDVFLDEVSAVDLYRSFAGLVLETALDLRTIVYDDRPIEEVITVLRERLPLGEWLSLRELVEDAVDRGNLIALFLATLELTRQQECEVDQRGHEVYLRRVLNEVAAAEAPSDPDTAELPGAPSVPAAADDDAVSG